MENPQKRAEARLTGVTLLKIELSELHELLPQGYLLNYNMMNTIAYNEEIKEIVIVNDLTITSPKDNDMQVGAIKTAIQFQISNYEDVVINNTIPRQLADMLINIALSTTRGIMCSEFKGTALHNAILPLVDIAVVPMFSDPEQAKQALDKYKADLKEGI